MLRLGLLPLYFLIFLCFNNYLKVLGEGDDAPYECSQGGHGPPDIIQNGAMNRKYMWSKRGSKTYVPVVLDHSYTHKERSTIIGGLREIQEKTCVEFDIYDSEHEVEEKDFVYINKNTKRGCYSYIGRIGGKQEMGLPVGCISHRTSMHEMLHALGFRHEHVRYDRDDYIIVFWGNIKQGRESNFRKRSPSDLVSGPYDYDSIMHYERKAFSKNKMDTIRPLKPGAKIGVRQEMSYWDAQKVNIVYNCGGRYSNSDVENLIEHSPALFGYTEGRGGHNESSLPIAEYDDFNSQPAPSNNHGRILHPDDDENDDHDPFPPPPPPQPHHHSHNHGRSHPRSPSRSSPPRNLDHDDGYENEENHFDNNRIHYSERNGPPRNRDYRNEEEEGDFHNYLSAERSPTPHNNNNHHNRNNVFYDDFYDF